jgi:EAL domain-containing protein (putative c-di-GMP-specific phosphodiesterase class I)/FixJ family two-component response regulator
MSASAMTGARIVVVDDEPANVALIGSILRRAGFTQVVSFVDPRLALEAVVHSQTDLVLLDLHMPHIDGLAFLDALHASRAYSAFVPVLVLTADVTRDALKNALRAGANDFVTKPIDADEVLLRVHNLLSIRFCHEELRNHNAALAGELRARARFDDEQAADRGHKIHAIQRIIERGGPDVVFQPFVELATGRTLGVEALARFGTEPKRPPNEWFADAATVGLGAELELSAIAAAFRQLEWLDPTWIMAVNLSPNTMFTDAFDELIGDVDVRRIAFEVTEHQAIDDYDALRSRAAAFRARGALLSVDDAGAGYASLRHILKLSPDIIKLDITLTRDVDTDPVKRALAASLKRFAEDIGAIITAEGIETDSELDALRDLGIHYGQGFYIAHPARLNREATREPDRTPGWGAGDAVIR